jgi:hypothetical protein
METPEENSFTASFSEGYCFSSGDPAGATIFIKRGGFDVGFDCVVEDVGRLFARYVIVVD